ncbi:hypothetical protein [Sphingomicrobium aestuariivivum]|uniref:hypothetical protein n=1 Tax=Sphingomicrobium aestuariivivum TaxID=1582356 RepID=UPI001FD7095C|nr:hypothetical protein [Sphingomicrobium aestuariivivum]MCJ8190578.1 hypothetical protein [Sphingomicrobium aestuariivivum]
MGLTLARVVVSFGIFCAPFFLYIAASSTPEDAMILIFPFIGAIPAIVGALVLFVPAEMLLDRLGAPALKNVVVPLLGASLSIISVLVIGAWTDSLGTLARNIAQHGSMFWGAMSVWAVLGAIWGLVWRSTEWLARKTGLVRA